ncbi:MAG: 23S rRNA (pseudouridine(1915)-N(3))-methyltransferase RlmH [Acidobacteriota bacterium]
MRVLIATIGARQARLAAPLFLDYLERIRRYIPCELRDFASEAKLLAFLDAAAARTTPAMLLTDSRGQALNSEELAGAIGKLRDGGLQQLVVAIGPADGWSPEALGRAQLKISFGRITLPHDLAAIIAAEQVYRAFTILAGHPYHSGH